MLNVIWVEAIWLQNQPCHVWWRCLTVVVGCRCSTCSTLVVYSLWWYIYIYPVHSGIIANHLPIFISKIFPEESSQHLLRVQHFDQHTEFTLGIDLSLFEELRFARFGETVQPISLVFFGRNLKKRCWDKFVETKGETINGVSCLLAGWCFLSTWYLWGMIKLPTNSIYLGGGVLA